MEEEEKQGKEKKVSPLLAKKLGEQNFSKYLSSCKFPMRHVGRNRKLVTKMQYWGELNSNLRWN
jgi:hypothetical protein